MTRLIACMFSTIKYFITCNITRMTVREYRIPIFTAQFIAGMDSTLLFSFTDILTLKLMFRISCDITLHFSVGLTTMACLLNYNLARRAFSLMTISGTNMTTLKYFFAWHSTTRNRIFTTFSTILIACQHH